MEKQNYNTTKQQLISTPIPIESRTYRPFSHEQVIELTLNSIVGAGFVLDREEYTSARGGEVATGKYTLKNVADKEMQIQIAWLNSYNKSKRLVWGIGSRVVICGNGNISADFGAFKKKHQGDISDYSPRAIQEYIGRAGDVFIQMQKEREEMKKIELSPEIRAKLIGEMFMLEDFITTTQLNIIKREVEIPSYDYGADNSLWQLYNHTTASLRDLHPSLYMKNHMDAHKFFSKNAGLIIPKGKIIVPTPGSHPQIELFESIPTDVLQ